MTKMIVEIPDQMHRIIKSLAGARGETLKDLVLRAIENSLKQEEKINIRNKNNEYISEEQADKMLRPVILKYIDQINKGKLRGYDKKEFFMKLKNS